MIQALIVKVLFGKIMEAIEKADDKRIARKHHKEIKELKKEVAKLKKDSHPPLFKKRDKRNIEKRLTKLEKKEK